MRQRHIGMTASTDRHIFVLYANYIHNDDSHCLVLEWIESNLWKTRGESMQAKAEVFKTVARCCLHALAVFEDMDGTGQFVHADIHPDNVLISEFSSATPKVKLADLGWTTRGGSNRGGTKWIQSDIIRAPEMWKGASPSAACDVWSLGVSLAHWMSSKILFGVGGCNIRTNQPQEVTEAGWCIAKLHKMCGAGLEGPIADDYVMEWAIADNLLSQDLVQISTLREALELNQVPPECIALIEQLLVVDPQRRPSVMGALANP